MILIATESAVYLHVRCESVCVSVLSLNIFLRLENMGSFSTLGVHQQQHGDQNSGPHKLNGLINIRDIDICVCVCV